MHWCSASELGQKYATQNYPSQGTPICKLHGPSIKPRMLTGERFQNTQKVQEERPDKLHCPWWWVDRGSSAWFTFPLVFQIAVALQTVTQQRNIVQDWRFALLCGRLWENAQNHALFAKHADSTWAKQICFRWFGKNTGRSASRWFKLTNFYAHPASSQLAEHMKSTLCHSLWTKPSNFSFDPSRKPTTLLHQQHEKM